MVGRTVKLQDAQGARTGKLLTPAGETSMAGRDQHSLGSRSPALFVAGWAEGRVVLPVVVRQRVEDRALVVVHEAQVPKAAEHHPSGIWGLAMGTGAVLDRFASGRTGQAECSQARRPGLVLVIDLGARRGAL